MYGRKIFKIEKEIIPSLSLLVDKKVKKLAMALRAISEASGSPHVFGMSDIKRFADDALADFEIKEK